MADSVAVGAPPRVGERPRTPERSLAGQLVRLRAWLRRPSLDLAIARGSGRRGDPAIELREAQLVEPRQRLRLALRLEDVLDMGATTRAASSAAPLDRDAVAAARPVLSQLVTSLRSTQPVRARGVALAWRLLTDPASPLYVPADGRSAARRLRSEALAALAALRPFASERSRAAV